MNDRLATWVAIGTVISGLIPLCIVLWKMSRVKKLLRSGLSTTGVVEAINKRFGHKGGRYFEAVISYHVPGGQHYRSVYTFTSGRKLKALVVGSAVDLYYDVHKPGKFVLKDFPYNKGFLVFATILAVAYAVIGYMLYVYIKHDSK